jgi:hypothetical protein
MAAELDAEVFTASEVLDLVECYVPLRIDLSRLPNDEMQELVARGYPFLEVWDATGASRHELDRTPAPGPFAESMRAGLTICGAGPEPADWERVRALASLFVEAGGAEADGRLGDAFEGYRALEGCAGRGAFQELARTARKRLAADASERFVRARTLAETDVEAAGELLREAAERYAGTPLAEDFASAARRLAKDGRFPPVATTRAS